MQLQLGNTTFDQEGTDQDTSKVIYQLPVSGGIKMPFFISPETGKFFWISR